MDLHGIGLAGETVTVEVGHPTSARDTALRYRESPAGPSELGTLTRTDRKLL